MWTWVSESRDLSIYQDLFLLLRLTYGKLWNVESQRNEYTGKLYNIYKWRNVLSRFQIYPAAFYFPMHNWLTDWLTWTKTHHLAKKVMESVEKEALAGSEEKSTEKSPFFFPSQQYLYNHHATPASSITNLLLEEVNAYKRLRWKLRFRTDWKTI